MVQNFLFLYYLRTFYFDYRSRKLPMIPCTKVISFFRNYFIKKRNIETWTTQMDSKFVTGLLLPFEFFLSCQQHNTKLAILPTTSFLLFPLLNLVWRKILLDLIDFSVQKELICPDMYKKVKLQLMHRHHSDQISLSVLETALLKIAQLTVG